MLQKLVDVVLRRHRAVLAVCVVLTLACGAFGLTLFDKLQGGGYTVPGSDSATAITELRDKFGQAPPNLVLLVDPKRPVDDPESARAATALVDRLQQQPDVTGVLSYWTSGRMAAMKDRAGTKGLIIASILGNETEVDHRVGDIADDLKANHEGVDIAVGGYAMMLRETIEQGEKDVVLGESVAFPLTLIALLLVFGSIVGALLPLTIGTVTSLITLGVLAGLARITDLVAGASNVASLLGLGLAIDYSLLIVNRYREEIAAGADKSTALRTTMHTAGRTVVFSAVTVAVALSAVLLFPLAAVRSLGYAGIATALISAAVSLTLLPALLLMAGDRVAIRRFGRKDRSGTASGSGFWHRLATFVMRRPIPVAVVGVLVLLAVGAPFLGFRAGFPDYRSLPESSTTREVAETLQRDFDATELTGLFVLLPDSSDGIDRYAATLSGLDGVKRVDAPTGSYQGGKLVLPATAAHQRFAADNAGYVSVIPTSADAAPVDDLVRTIRAVDAPSRALVGGVNAGNIDAVDSLADRAPLALVYVLIVMIALLFLLTGSVFVPLLALVLSALSLTATFGALVWVFQEGHLAGLLGGFTVTGDLSAVIPVTLFALAFGLAMDYQVFLLSRIREEYERTGDTTAAVAIGLERIGRIVTAAAILISIVFLGFLASDITFMKAFGVGLPLAVLADATVVRGLLLPAAMKLGGRWVWWAPAPLRKLHNRFGISEGAGPTADQVAGEPAAT